jgi:hypothetical protein
MGVFFRSRSLTPVVNEAIQDALRQPPPTDQAAAARLASEAAAGVASQVSGDFDWKRAAVGIVLLAIVLGAGLYAGQNSQLKDWSTALLHTFEVLAGGLVGLIVGEAAARSA